MASEGEGIHVFSTMRGLVEGHGRQHSQHRLLGPEGGPGTPAVPTTAICCLTVLLAVCEEQVEIKWEL